MTADGSCPGCDGRCCARYRVGVNGADAQRLSRALALPVESFAGLMPVEPDGRGALRLDESDQHWSLELHHRDDGACVLLVDLLGGTGRCGVYDDRPSACLVYPATFDGERIQMRSDAVCREQGGCGFTGHPPAHWYGLLEAMEADWAVYEAALTGWAAWRPEAATPHTFLGWLAETYRRLDDVAPEQRLEQAAAIGAAI